MLDARTCTEHAVEKLRQKARKQRGRSVGLGDFDSNASRIVLRSASHRRGAGKFVQISPSLVLPVSYLLDPAVQDEAWMRQLGTAANCQGCDGQLYRIFAVCSQAVRQWNRFAAAATTLDEVQRMFTAEWRSSRIECTSVGCAVWRFLAARKCKFVPAFEIADLVARWQCWCLNFEPHFRDRILMSSLVLQ